MAASDLSPSDFKGLFFIRDSLRYRGQPTLQAISNHLGFKSRRSATLLIERLTSKGYLERTVKGTLRVVREPDNHAQTERTVEIPLVGTAPCGMPLLAEENIEAMIPVSQRIVRPGAVYFLLRASGTSMNKAGINDGDLVIVRQQPVAENGDRVVALLDDSATIKEFRREGNKVVLISRSTDAAHKPIILERDFLVQGIVIDSIPYPEE
jgi:repressor LexA